VVKLRLPKSGFSNTIRSQKLWRHNRLTTIRSEKRSGTCTANREELECQGQLGL
jgi:hypothetical protein